MGGFVLGLVASRVRKGPLIIAAYTAFGVLLVGIGFLPPVGIVLGLLFGIGIANMAFVIPSQTLFQERTPIELMARVVSFRFALVFGGMTVAMAVGGIVADVLGHRSGLRARRAWCRSVRAWRACSCEPSATPDGRVRPERPSLGTLTAA